LNNNRLSGSIPVWIGKLKNLEELLLDGNSLSGPIPKELGNLQKLTVIRLGHNCLTGRIPSSLGKLTHLADNKSNFKWNALYTNNDSLKTFLRKIQY
ncbi:MAG: Two component regulator three Y domain protein, partial [Candidatus Aminicenantes bacterium]|nr:Two component regulator three Y domain protein [Candidatus Aminicenantes bacterium]NIM82556.1 Two component regulator three Y domain protein [Candidatus Aminicenantes bacterium]NIN21916.1 Two component regulator three Y domain protein [Candidatus Aminicenantes bacterium]NIN45694.1 Two component regulator three Y domain protein [Candidatus Aminicenantes bacterium]NIN88529.1 Two component regulator three Y domain protein [Candidatus Aminicenantes bacterium]